MDKSRLSRPVGDDVVERRHAIAEQLEKALVEKNADRFRTIALFERHTILAALSSIPVSTEAKCPADELDICPHCDGSGSGVADTTCDLCGGCGGVPVEPRAPPAEPSGEDAPVSTEAVSEPILVADNSPLEHSVEMRRTPETRIKPTAPSGEVVQAEDHTRGIELWFFRELSDEQRRSLIALTLGKDVAEEAKPHAWQRLCLKRILRDHRLAFSHPSERAQIVAWLRECEQAMGHVEGGAIWDVAAAIERGDHLSTPSDTVTHPDRLAHSGVGNVVGALPTMRGAFRTTVSGDGTRPRHIMTHIVERPEPLRIAVARMIALHGLGKADGTHRSNPPNEKWDQDEWERRILECVPSLVKIRCMKLADDMISLVKSGVWP